MMPFLHLFTTLRGTSKARGHLAGFQRVMMALLLILVATFLPAKDTRCFTRTYHWTSEGKAYAMSVDLPWEGYDFYAQVPRVYAQYGVYAFEHPDHAVLKNVVAQFMGIAKRRRLSEWSSIQLVVSFVQQLSYQSEPGEYPKFPAETLADGGGDCEDLSVLLSGILREMGYATRLVNPPGHMAVALACKDCDGLYFAKEGRKYFYIETTSPAYAIGEAPVQYHHSKNRLFDTELEGMALDYLDRASRKRTTRPPLYYVREDEHRRALRWGDEEWVASARVRTVNVNGNREKRSVLTGIGEDEYRILPPLAWAVRANQQSRLSNSLMPVWVRP